MESLQEVVLRWQRMPGVLLKLLMNMDVQLTTASSPLSWKLEMLWNHLTKPSDSQNLTELSSSVMSNIALEGVNLLSVESAEITLNPGVKDEDEGEATTSIPTKQMMR